MTVYKVSDSRNNEKFKKTFMIEFQDWEIEVKNTLREIIKKLN